MSERQSQGLVRDLEELTSLSLHMLEDVDVGEMEDERLRYAAGMFKAMRLAAEAIIRTHPASDYYLSRSSDIWIETWNPVVIKVVNRFLIDAYLDFHHLFLDTMLDGEADFRLIMAQLHGVRNLLERAPGPSNDDVPSPQSNAELYESALRRALPDKERYYADRLAANSYFLGCELTEDDRAGLLSRRSHKAPYRYGGINCQPGRKKKAERAGIRPFIADELHGYLSDFIHAGPAVADSLVFFSPRVAYARQQQIDLPVAISCGVMAVAIRGFAELFPCCKGRLQGDAHILVNHYASLVTVDDRGPSPERPEDGSA
jgi:hypothetical protein